MDTDLAIKLTKYLDSQFEDVPHDIGMVILNIIEAHETGGPVFGSPEWLDQLQEAYKKTGESSTGPFRETNKLINGGL